MGKLCSAFVLVGAIACSESGPSRGSEADLARAKNLQAELVGSGAAYSSSAVVSDIEVPPSAPLAAARAGNTDNPAGGALGKAANSGTRAVSNVSRSEGKATAALNSASDSLALNSSIGKIRVPTPVLAVATTSSKVAVENQPMDIPNPKAPPVTAQPGLGEGEEAGTAVARGPTEEVTRPRPPEVTRGPVIEVIRGGSGEGRIDPCARHPQGPNTGNIMINNRIPTRTPPFQTPGAVRIPR